jgi:hypothetical protein
VKNGESSEAAAELRRRADLVHAHVPGARVLAAGQPNKALADFVDVFESELKVSKEARTLQELRDCLFAIAGRTKRRERYRAIVAEARALLAANEDRAPGAPLVEREKIAALIPRMKATAARFVPWDPGQMTYEKAVEVRVARQTAGRRRPLRARHLAACRTLGVEPLGQESWDGLWPMRTLWRQDFEGAGYWEGQIVTDNVPAGSRRALAGQEGKRYAARRIRVGIFHDYARAATTTWLRFKYFVNRPGRFEVMAFDLTQRDNYATNIAEPVLGKWTEVTLQITGKWRRKDRTEASMAAGDAVDDVFFMAGEPGDKQYQLLVDDVELVGRD